VWLVKFCVVQAFSLYSEYDYNLSVLSSEAKLRAFVTLVRDGCLKCLQVDVVFHCFSCFHVRTCYCLSENFRSTVAFYSFFVVPTLALRL
jgi:hypothetical protein